MKINLGVIIPGIILQFTAAIANSDIQSETVFSAVGSGTIDRSAGPVTDRIEINALQDSSRASLRIGQSTSESDSDVGRFSTFALTASAPLNKSDDKTDLATLDSLSNAFTLSFKYTQLTVPDKRNPQLDVEENAKLFDSICASMRENFKSRTGANDEAAEKRTCDTANVKQDAPDRLLEFKRLFWDPNGFRWLWGMEGTVGYENFDYKDPNTFESKDENKVPWAGKMFGGLFLNRWNALLTFGGEYQNSYKDAAKQTICPAGGGSGPVVCQTDSFGEPDDDDRKLLFLEARKTILGAGVSLKVTRDFDQDTTGVDVPVYLIRNPKGGLAGGVRGGWRSDTDDLEFGVFVGSSFKLFD